MHNELFSIGPITVYGYGLMIAIGIIAALIMGEYRAKKQGLDADYIYGLTFVTVIVGFMGAKLLYALTEWEAFVKDPIHTLISGNGFVVFGGIIVGAFAMFTYCKLTKHEFLDYFDLMLPSVALAQGFGRIGCFLAGCCYGRETSCAIGITFHDSPFAPNGVSLMPTQLMMSAGDFLLALALILYARRKHVKGQVGTLYLILYSIGRFIIEFYRNDYRGSIGPLSTSQFIGLIVAVISIGIFFFLGRRGQLNKE